MTNSIERMIKRNLCWNFSPRSLDKWQTYSLGLPWELTDKQIVSIAYLTCMANIKVQAKYFWDILLVKLLLAHMELCCGLLFIVHLSVVHIFDISSRIVRHWAETWWEALGLHGDSELLKLLCSDIQDGGHLEIVQTASPLKPCWIELKLDGRHWEDMEIQNCYNQFVLISKIAATASILKIFKPHLLLNAKLDWAQAWLEALGRHGDSELLKSFHSNI